MAYNHLRLKEKIRRQYTFTKTKAVLAFFFSAVFSIIFSTYLDDHILRLMKRSQSYVGSAISTATASPAQPKVLEGQKAKSQGSNASSESSSKIEEEAAIAKEPLSGRPGHDLSDLQRRLDPVVISGGSET